jgi:hypothetical protein
MLLIEMSHRIQLEFYTFFIHDFVSGESGIAEAVKNGCGLDIKF